MLEVGIKNNERVGDYYKFRTICGDPDTWLEINDHTVNCINPARPYTEGLDYDKNGFSDPILTCEACKELVIKLYHEGGTMERGDNWFI